MLEPMSRALQEATERSSPAGRREAVERLLQEVLGRQATRPLEMLQQAGDSPAGLAKAAKEIERFTRLFVDKGKAAELQRRLQIVLKEKRE